jgi:outer membrane protein OmpA-like peptidoglycan-associated protein
MTALKRAIWPLMAAPIGACIATNPASQPAVPSGHHFRYSIVDQDRIHLVQAFDDGGSTYLQFDQMPSASAEIQEVTHGATIRYTIEPHFFVAPGVYAALRVSVGEQSATVTNDDEVRANASPTAHLATIPASEAGQQEEDTAMTSQFALADPVARAPLPLSSVAEPMTPYRAPLVGIPEALQTMSPTLRVATLKQEIATLEERVRFLSEELEEAHRAGRGSTLYIRDIAGSPRIAVKFEDNSAAVHVDDALLGALGNTVRAANRIYLHGHTDAYVASDTGTQLAIRRAVEVRSLLISLNVEPERMRMFYRGAGNFVANNSTADGKALNRRVEIELRKW